MSEAHQSGIAYFCSQTGVRLVAPGVSREVDPINGVLPYEHKDVDKQHEKSTKHGHK